MKFHCIKGHHSSRDDLYPSVRTWDVRFQKELTVSLARMESLGLCNEEVSNVVMSDSWHYEQLALHP